MLREHGGALLADDVGLGKTYVAAALAREYERVLVVAPATLRAMWCDALHDVGAQGNVVSYAALSRGGGPREHFDLVLLDEAHHTRTPETRRYQRVAELADGAHMVMLSATPIHNSRADLAALLALFLGARAFTLGDDALSKHVIRRERDDVPTARLPATAAPTRLTVGDDGALLRAILALPPPLPPRDAGAGGALVAWGLVREWASSSAALVGALRRRLARASALGAALEGGRFPSRQELATWVCGDRAVQLAFPEMLDAPVSNDTARLQSVLAMHERGVRALLERAHASAWTDARRAQLLRELRVRHAGEKIIAFTQFADSARALFRELRCDAGVAVLTARGASVAGGALSRREAIERFAPRATGVRAPRAVERIDLLIATDLLSEGVNLHDASVVVHIDLPWTPARMEQRVGRSRRMGALHAQTTVYTLQPPASSEALLRVEQRLHAKLGAAARLFGAAGDILPEVAIEGRDADAADEGTAQRGGATSESAARRRESIVRELERWREQRGEAPVASRVDDPALSSTVVSATAPSGAAVSGAAVGSTVVSTTVGIARAAAPALLALVREDGEYRLVAAASDGEVNDDPALVLEVARLASGALAASRDAAFHIEPLRPDHLAAFDRVARWSSRRAGALAAGSHIEPHAQARKRALRRVAAIVAGAPRHRRAEITRLGALARQVATAPYGVGVERALEELVATDVASGEEWLRTLGEFGEAHRSTTRSSSAPRVEPVAVLILVR